MPTVQMIHSVLPAPFKAICRGMVFFLSLVHHTINYEFILIKKKYDFPHRFGQDCNGDGKINCYDHAAIHIKGGYGCKGDLPEKYNGVFNACIQQFLQQQ